MSLLSCKHVEDHRKERGTRTYSLIHTFFIACVSQGSRERKIQECFCYTCNTRSHRLHACLACVFFGCYDNNHIQQHAETVGHLLAVDTTFGQIYCFACNDYMYDCEFEKVSEDQQQKVVRCIGPWLPKVKLLKEENNESCNILYSNYLGLRGLVNLGQTCYMNCIVQVLTHNPLLRNYFLADKHNADTYHQFKCDRSTCLACEMSTLFQEFYSGERTPHIPYQLVYIIWKHAKHLDGYNPQDAHEFFITMLDILHEHMKGEKDDDLLCGCIIHKMFTGYLQSDVLCLNCKKVRTKVESFRDICLDLGATDKAGNSRESVSLKNCLQRYTQPEQLQIECESCQRICLSAKQLTVQKLPFVLSFHLKRLEFGKKKTTFVSFPEYLDMTPFISSIRGRSEFNGEKHHSGTNSGEENSFCLFAVVNHSGDKENGHYVSFIKMKHCWYKCDDELITVANKHDVLLSEGYLLFYHKEKIDYEEETLKEGN